MLSREECLEILGLNQNANKYDIENRYTTLLKRNRGKSDAEALENLDQVTLAYSILTGRYVEPEPVNPRLEEVVLGKTKRQWRNIWHYGRAPLLVGLIIAFIIGYFIYSIVTNKPADFQIALVGVYGMTADSENHIDSYVKEVLPDVQNFEFQYLPIDFREPDDLDDQNTTVDSGTDPQSQYAFVMKMMTMMAADTVEVYICDSLVFNHYATQGAFTELDELYLRLQDLPASVLEKIVPQRRPLFIDYELPDDMTVTPTPGPTADEYNQDLDLPIVGLDISLLDLTEGLGMYSESQVITVGHRAEDLEQVFYFIESWIRDYERMSEQRQVFEDAMASEAELEQG